MRKSFDTSPEALAEDLLGRPFDELDEDEKRVLCRVASTEIELDPDEIDVVNVRLGDRMADRVAAIGGSWGFIIAFLALMVLWMALNVMQAWGVRFDPFPFILLNLTLSTLAALQAPIILMSQNRQAKKDRITNRHDYEINLRTVVEITRLSRKLDRIAHFAVREAKKAEETIEEAMEEVRHQS
ncbi:DUF1003 domain-containing protein [Tsuneonella sp. HG249]